jgi:hypothetical protein
MSRNERDWKDIGDGLQGPCYLGRDDHDRKDGSGEQRTDIGACSFGIATIELWGRPPADVWVLCYKQSNFGRRIGRVINRAGWGFGGDRRRAQ